MGLLELKENARGSFNEELSCFCSPGIHVSFIRGQGLYGVAIRRCFVNGSGALMPLSHRPRVRLSNGSLSMGKMKTITLQQANKEAPTQREKKSTKQKSPFRRHRVAFTHDSRGRAGREREAGK